MKNNPNKIKLILATIFLIYIPFQALFLELMTDTFHLGGQVAFWGSHWYEVVILVMCVETFLRMILSKQKIIAWQKVSLVLILLGIVSIFFISSGIGRGIEGFRITLSFLLALFALSNCNREDVEKLVSVYLKIALVISLWAIIERFIGAGYWQKYLHFAPAFGFGNYSVGSTPRSDSFFNGPSQLSNYLLPAAFLLGNSIAEKKSKLTSSNYLSYSVILLAIGFAYSRAALIGLVFGLFVMFFWVFKNWSDRIKIFIISVVMISIPLFVASAKQNSAQTILTHNTSQSSHVAALNTTTQEIKNRLGEPAKLIFGSGLGSAGPLVLKYHDGLISESWYLQLVLELGFVGLLLWILLMSRILISLYKRNAGLFLGLVATSIAALFLHTFADSPATSLTLFLLIGASLTERKSVVTQ